MSTHPMELLKQNVTSVIINEQSSLINEKNDVLSRFYPILLSRFLLKPELVEQLKERLTPSVFDVVERNELVRYALLLRLSAGRIAVAEVEQILNRAIPKSLATLSNYAGNDTVSLIHYLREHRLSIHSLLPVWSEAVLSPLDQQEEPEVKENLVEIVEMDSSLALETEIRRHSRIFPFFTLFLASFSLIWLYQLIK